MAIWLFFQSYCHCQVGPLLTLILKNNCSETCAFTYILSIHFIVSRAVESCPHYVDTIHRFTKLKDSLGKLIVPKILVYGQWKIVQWHNVIFVLVQLRHFGVCFEHFYPQCFSLWNGELFAAPSINPVKRSFEQRKETLIKSYTI